MQDQCTKTYKELLEKTKPVNEMKADHIHGQEDSGSLRRQFSLNGSAEPLWSHIKLEQASKNRKGQADSKIYVEIQPIGSSQNNFRKDEQSWRTSSRR